MKRHSIRFKFFAAISAVAVVFIGVLLLLNLFLYDDYYLMTRRAELRKTYESIQRVYTGDITDITETLDALENRNAVRLAIVTKSGIIYTPSGSLDSAPISPHSNASGSDAAYPTPQAPYLDRFSGKEQPYRIFDVLFSAIRTVDFSQLDESRYQFSTIALTDNEQYLCLTGVIGEKDADLLVAYMPYAFIEQNSTFTLLFLLIAGGCALVICIICGYFISRQFTRPLITMGAIANNMSRLDFTKKYEGNETDEIGQLGQSLNRLSAYLEQSIGELQQSNEQLAQEIEEKQRIDDMRREFIVNVSHELKTPIAVIQGYAEGLQLGVADDPEDRKFYCDTITDEADHMNKLVMQLLNLSKLELGAEQTYVDDVDLHSLCADAVRKTAVLCNSRGLTVGYAHTDATVHTDGDMLEQVLMNYLSNAIRYTADGGHIELSAVNTATGIRLCVFNEGDGLPEEELPKVWEKFYRTDRARSRENGGTGIGLSLVRAIAETLHGACGAENTEGGIIFWFEIPNAEE